MLPALAPANQASNRHRIRPHSKMGSFSTQLMAIGFLSAVAVSGAFQQLSMVSSSSPRTFGSASQLKSSSSTSSSRSSSIFSDPFATAASALAGNFNLSSGLISQLAVLALKVRLADHQSVDCDVTARPTDLLHGRVGPVTVQGRGWQSGLGLTCRAIEAVVDSCELDTRRVLTDRKLVLTTPARGTATIALNAADFANFITHPRMKPPTLPLEKVGSTSIGDASDIRFLKEGTHIDPATGTVAFFAEYANQRWKCLLKRGDPRKNQSNAVVTVLMPSSLAKDDHDNVWREAGQQLSKALGNFFNEMVFELDGTFLSFRDMKVTGPGGAAAATVMLSLQIQVHKLPSRNLAF